MTITERLYLLLTCTLVQTYYICTICNSLSPFEFQASGSRKAVVCDHQLPLRDCRQGNVLHGRGKLERLIRRHHSSGESMTLTTRSVCH